MTFNDIVQNAPHVGVKNLTKEQYKDKYDYFKQYLHDVMEDKVTIDLDTAAPYSKVSTLRIHKAMIGRDNQKSIELMDYVNAGAKVIPVPSDSAFITLVILHK